MLNQNNKGTRWMQLPREVVVGSDAINCTIEICNKLNLDDGALIITGKSTQKIAGNIVYDYIHDAGQRVEQIISSDASTNEVEKIKNFALKNNIKYLLGVGSGKSIDIAKLVATTLNIPFLSVPTAASHDGIVSSRASLLHNGKSTSINASAPLGVIADTKIIANAPHKLLAAGCGDIISNYTAILDWNLARRLKNEPFSEYAAALSKMTAEILIDSKDVMKPNLESSARIVIKALVSSGVAISIAGSSRPASGSEHSFNHALNMIVPNPALHGEQCGVGTILMMYLHGGDWKMIRDCLKSIGAPTNANELGIEEKYILEALCIAHKIRPDRYTILGTGLSEDAAVKLAKTTGVI